MSELPVATKEFPAPLDAFETAKPDEPIWTVQGGDPLGPPLLRLWSLMARIRAGAVSTKLIAQWVEGVKEVAESHSVANNERESENLLVRATATEQISWRMDEYARGHDYADKPTEADDTHIDELARIDLHKARVHAAEKVSYMCGDLEQILVELAPSWLAVGGGEEVEAMMPELRDLIERLAAVRDEIEPRRIFKKDPR